MNIFINWDNDKESIQLPINPETFEIEGSQNNTSVVVQNLGEINLKGKRNLYGLSFESFFPAQQYDFAQCSFEDPYSYVNRIKKLMEDNTTVHVIITETDINMQCTIESFTYGQEENGDVNYSIYFKEDRGNGSADASKAKTVNNKVKKASTKRKSKAVKSQKYKWKSGDTWHKVAKKKTGTSANYRAIRKQNSSVIKKAKKKHPKKKEKDALVGFEVVIKVD